MKPFFRNLLEAIVEGSDPKFMVYSSIALIILAMIFIIGISWL